MKVFGCELRCLVVAAACMSGLLPAARAELWAYVDAAGVAHFAAQKQDERYSLFSRDSESFDSAGGLRQDGMLRMAGPAAPARSPHPRALASIEVSPSYRRVKQHLREASSKHDIDYELLKALIVTESGFDPAAVSPKGAVGLMQIMPATAERYGVVGDTKTPVQRKLIDPRTNIRAGARYLSYLLNLFPGKLELALAAYNAGEGAVQRAGNRIPNYPETQNYVRTVIALYQLQKPASTTIAAGIATGIGNGNNSSSGASRIRMVLPGLVLSTSPGSELSQVAALDVGHAQRGPRGGAAGRGNLPVLDRREALVAAPAAADPAAPRE